MAASRPVFIPQDIATDTRMNEGVKLSRIIRDLQQRQLNILREMHVLTFNTTTPSDERANHLKEFELEFMTLTHTISECKKRRSEQLHNEQESDIKCSSIIRVRGNSPYMQRTTPAIQGTNKENFSVEVRLRSNTL